MARHKNAERQHLIAPVVDGNLETEPTDFMPLATYITNIEANNTEESENQAYYHGDGTPETDILSIAKGYNVSGERYYSDPAQDHIAELEGKTGEDRKVWHKVIQANKEKEFLGVATVSEIVADGGEAGANETFSCTITYDKYPEVSETPAG